MLVFVRSCCHLRFLTHVTRLLGPLLTLILHVVSLLLHVVRDVDFREQHLLATCNRELFIGLFLANLCHFLPSSVIVFLLLDQVVSLSLL